jgi:hypothetical protein
MHKLQSSLPCMWHQHSPSSAVELVVEVATSGCGDPAADPCMTDWQALARESIPVVAAPSKRRELVRCTNTRTFFGAIAFSSECVMREEDVKRTGGCLAVRLRWAWFGHVLTVLLL